MAETHRYYTPKVYFLYDCAAVLKDNSYSTLFRGYYMTIDAGKEAYERARQMHADASDFENVTFAVEPVAVIWTHGPNNVSHYFALGKEIKLN